MSELGLIITVAIIGWMSVALLLGIIIGKAAKLGDGMYNMKPQKAEVWLPDLDPGMSDADDEEVDDVIQLDARRQSRDSETPNWSEDTVKKGMEALGALYAQSGMQATQAELREETLLMLNSQNGEIE